jgi:hypothetical protein
MTKKNTRDYLNSSKKSNPEYRIYCEGKSEKNFLQEIIFKDKPSHIKIKYFCEDSCSNFKSLYKKFTDEIKKENYDKYFIIFDMDGCEKNKNKFDENCEHVKTISPNDNLILLPNNKHLEAILKNFLGTKYWDKNKYKKPNMENIAKWFEAKAKGEKIGDIILEFLECYKVIWDGLDRQNNKKDIWDGLDRQNNKKENFEFITFQSAITYSGMHKLQTIFDEY